MPIIASHMLRLLSGAAVFLQLISAACALAQGPAALQTTLRDRPVELPNAAALPGLPDTGTFAPPFTCSSNGDIYISETGFDENGRPVAPVPDLFKISPTGTVKRIPRPLPTDFKIFDSAGFFAGESTLVTVIRAAQPVDEHAAQAHPGATTFLSVTDPDGDHPRLIRLDLGFNMVKAAAFDSGGFVVLGLDLKSFQPAVAILNDDGQLERYLNLFSNADKPSAKGEPDSAAEKARQRAMFLSIGAAQFAPWGSDVLLVAPVIDNSSVYHIRASGQVERVPIRLPNGEQLESVLGSGMRDDWVVRTIAADSAKTLAKANLVENPQEFLYEVNPRSGEVLQRLAVTGPQPAGVACAANGKLSAIYMGDPQQPGAPGRLVLASAPR